MTAAAPADAGWSIDVVGTKAEILGLIEDKFATMADGDVSPVTVIECWGAFEPILTDTLARCDAGPEGHVHIKASAPWAGVPVRMLVVPVDAPPKPVPKPTPAREPGPAPEAWASAPPGWMASAEELAAAERWKAMHASSSPTWMVVDALRRGT